MSRAASPGRVRSFYTVMGLAISAIVLIGFSRSYFLRPWLELPPLTMRLHFHGLVMTLWLGLFLVQTRLVAAGRRGIHKALGFAGLALAAIAIAATYAAAMEAARLEPARGGISSADRLYSSVVILVLFAGFVTAGAAFRRRREVHRRLMLLASMAIVGPGATRAVRLIVGHGIPDSHIPVMVALILSALAYDWRTRGRPHWVLVAGGLLLIASQLTRRLVGGSHLWAQIGGWLIG